MHKLIVPCLVELLTIVIILLHRLFIFILCCIIHRHINFLRRISVLLHRASSTALVFNLIETRHTCSAFTIHTIVIVTLLKLSACLMKWHHYSRSYPFGFQLIIKVYSSQIFAFSSFQNLLLRLILFCMLLLFL